MKKTTKEKFVTTIQNKKLPISKTRSFNKNIMRLVIILLKIQEIVI